MTGGPSVEQGPVAELALPSAAAATEDPEGLPVEHALGEQSLGEDPADGQSPDEEPGDWAWVEEWRAGGEPVPWGPGLAIAGFTVFLVASAVYVLSSGLSDRPLVAIVVNIVVAAGLGPALWLSRGLPVLRWIAAGAVVGVLAAWLSDFIFLT